tara:strand:- start:288 stop:2120 length:1833 start_codon:yes stop_codon:yes gene_type:complete
MSKSLLQKLQTPADNSSEAQALTTQENQQILYEYFIPNFTLLDAQTQAEFKATENGLKIEEFIPEFLARFAQLPYWWNLLRNRTAEEQELEKTLSRALKRWSKWVANDEAYNTLQQQISQAIKQKFNNENEHFLQTFPLIHLRHPFNSQSVAADFSMLVGVLDESGHKTLLKKFQKQKLTQFLFDSFEALTANLNSFIDLTEFHKRYAAQMARAIIKHAQAHQENTQFNWHAYLTEQNDYAAQLAEFITHEWSLINQKKDYQSHNIDMSQMTHSVAYNLLTKGIKKSKKFANKLADAHAFIQLTGGATQNENSYLVVLDLYNYYRHFETIDEAKNISVKLMKIFLPLYHEYRNLSFYEKNTFWKVYRLVMPLVVVTAVVALVMLAIAPLALPELVLSLAFIPAVITGLYVATLYVRGKDYLYHTLRCRYYGGEFNLPQFQLNTRLTQAFKEQAPQVRAFYIAELKKCDALLASFEAGFKAGILDDDALERRKDIGKRRLQLSLEWYDLHSNAELGIDSLPTIVTKRLDETIQASFAELQTAMQQNMPKNTACYREKTIRFFDDNHAHPAPDQLLRYPTTRCSLQFFAKVKSKHQRMSALDNLATSITPAT